MDLVSARDLVRVFRMGESEVRAVDGLDLGIEAGEFISIVGPSGSGKSTLLNLLGCLDRPTSGSVRIDGVDTGALSGAERTRLRREKIGFIFQEFNLLSVQTARENVELPLRYTGVKNSRRRKRAESALELVGLSGRMNHRPSELSGGERQRIAIARALVTDPVLVLADEPTGELDTENTGKVLELMERLNLELGQTFAVVTHDPMVAGYTRRVVSIRDGRIESDRISLEERKAPAVL